MPKSAPCPGMPFKLGMLLLFVFMELWILVLLCSPNRTIPNQDAPVPGMREITSAGKSFMQGADDPLANADEKPPMMSMFTYDYQIDTALVTQKEYFDIMGRQPVSATSPFGKGDDYPVYNVSWFDAVLFCNAKSKKEKLDTVYSYSGAPQTQQGGVYNLIDARAHYERNGFRLPTESEWEFAAREGTSSLPFPHLPDNIHAQYYSWYLANSSDHTHPVASLSANAFGLYDMAGNVFEWTGDWKGFYRIPRITNSIGASQPNMSNERVVKGGSFKTDFSSLRPSHRSAIYETSPSVATEYIGFRCARGAIPSVSYISKDTLRAETNSTALVAGTSRPFLGTHRARLVFVNVTKELRTLCFVDFGTSYPVVHEYKSMTSVYVPVISPNGKYAAFCTRNDGQSGTAAIYIRNLDSLEASPSKIPSDFAFEPRFWVDPVSFDTFCIFTNSAIDDNSPQWPSTGTFIIKIAGGKPVGATQQLINRGSYHDGRSANGRYIVTGFSKLIMRDMATEQDRPLFLSPQNGKGPSGSTQVCNASICQDPRESDRCLFIDFGCVPPMVSALTGNSYGIHEYLFIQEYSGTVLSWYRRPDGEASWDYPEWSNVGRFAVACVRNDRDEAHAIYLINLRDSCYGKVVEGKELAHPFLWVNRQDISLLDSLNAARLQDSLNVVRLQDSLNAARIQDSLNAVRLQDSLNAARIQDSLSAVRLQDSLNAVRLQDSLSAARLQDSLNAARVRDSLNFARLRDSLSAARLRDSLNAARLQDSLNAAKLHVALNTDSLGYYNDPPLAIPLEGLNRRMRDFWHDRKDMKIVFVGSSHTANSIDPHFFSGTPVYNMAIEGGDFAITMGIIKNYIINHCPSIQCIGCDIIPCIFNTATFFAERSPLVPNKGFTYDQNHDYWKNGLPDNFESFMQLAPCPIDPRIDTLGLMQADCANWGDTNPVVWDSTRLKWTVDDPDYKADFNIIKELADFLAHNKIHFLMYTTPESPYYRSTGLYSSCGASMNTGTAIIGQLKALEDSFPPYVHFYDGHLGGYHDYADSEAHDVGHLCITGAKKFSVRMDSVVHSIIHQ
jgi:uncharacterized protein (TIGR02171 family)